MLLNLHHKILGKKDPLTRKEIDDYLSGRLSQEEQHLIEEKLESSDFDNEAMEGFRNSGLTTEILQKRMDKHFLSPSNFIWIATTLSFFLVTALYFFIAPTGTKELVSTITTDLTPVSQAPETAFIEEEEILSQEPVHEILPETTITNTNLQESNSQPKESESTEQYESYIPQLPPRQTHPLSLKPAQFDILLNYEKEIYLSELKFIDFRSIRTTPITTRGVFLSGTEAGYENRDSESSALPWETIEVNYHDYLSKTAIYIKEGKWNLAIPRLEKILEQYPTDENGLFYLGFCYFQTHNYTEALPRFVASGESFRQNFYEESLWYSYLSNKKLGNTIKAEQLRIQIIEENGFYAKQAEMQK